MDKKTQKININTLKDKFETSDVSSMVIRFIKRKRLKVVNRKYKNSIGVVKALKQDIKTVDVQSQ